MLQNSSITRLSNLQVFKYLITVNLDNCKLDDATVRPLAALQSLKNVFLRHNELTMLPAMRNLDLLDVSDNPLSQKLFQTEQLGIKRLIFGKTGLTGYNFIG